MDKYGFLDAQYFLFDCTLDGEVIEYAARGNDIDGWLDVFPVNDEGKVLSVSALRKHGAVVFTNVRIVLRHGYLASSLVEDLYGLREKVAQLRLDYREVPLALQRIEKAIRALEEAQQMLREDLAREPALKL